VRTDAGGEVADVVPVGAGDEETSEQGGDAEIVRVLAPMPGSEYASWRAVEISRREAARLTEKQARAGARGKSPEKQKLTAKDRESVAAQLPETLFEALQIDTGDLRKDGWSAPPGSRWLDYRRPAGKISARPAPQLARKNAEAKRTVARFALASAVLPRLTEAVPVAEKLRKGLMSRGGAVPVFTGKDDDGRPLRGHCHAFILPEANGRNGRLTHVTVHAERGFGPKALSALHRLSKVWGHGGHDIQTVLIGIGTREAFAGTNLEAGECPLLVESEIWVSRTPFVPTRHPKSTRAGEPKVDDRGLQIGSPEHDLRRLLEELRPDDPLPEPVRVAPTNGAYLGGKAVRWSAFRTQRDQGEGRRASGLAYGFRIEFPRPVAGPIAVGYGAHFGLGMFVPPIDRFRPVEIRE
jgi:CRISPR-associated protein Csb2